MSKNPHIPTHLDLGGNSIPFPHALSIIDQPTLDIEADIEGIGYSYSQAYANLSHDPSATYHARLSRTPAGSIRSTRGSPGPQQFSRVAEENEERRHSRDSRSGDPVLPEDITEAIMSLLPRVEARAAALARDRKRRNPFAISLRSWSLKNPQRFLYRRNDSLRSTPSSEDPHSSSSTIGPPINNENSPYRRGGLRDSLSFLSHVWGSNSSLDTIRPINRENPQLRPYPSSTALQSNGSVYNASFMTSSSYDDSLIEVMNDIAEVCLPGHDVRYNNT